MSKTITLNNNVEMPLLGLGVFQSKDGIEAENAVKWALAAGYRHIDTAKIYGNESSVGKAMKESGVPREEIFLTTKLWNEDIRNRNARAAFEKSLEALQTDYVDMYLIHWPTDGFAEAWPVLEELYEEGKIKAIGVSNFHKVHFDELFKIAKIIPTINQIESHPLLANQELIDYCHDKRIAISAWSPLGGTGGNLMENTALKELAKKYNRTVAQIILRWDIQRGIVVLPKSVHQERIISNMGIFDFEISAEDMKKINELNKNQRTGADPENFNF